MKGFSKRSYKFLIMGGGLFILLLIVYMSMRKIEGFQQTSIDSVTKCNNTCTTSCRGLMTPNTMSKYGTCMTTCKANCPAR